MILAVVCAIRKETNKKANSQSIKLLLILLTLHLILSPVNLLLLSLKEQLMCLRYYGVRTLQTMIADVTQLPFGGITSVVLTESMILFSIFSDFHQLYSAFCCDIQGPCFSTKTPSNQYRQSDVKENASYRPSFP